MKLALTLLAALAPLATLAADKACQSPSAIAAAQARIDDTLQAIARDPGERQAKLDAAVKAKGDAQGWPQARQEALLKQVLSSSAPDARATKCQAAKETATLGRKIAEVSERRYRHAADEIARAAAPAP